MNKPTRLLSAALVLLFLAVGTSAQTNPTMTDQQRDSEKERFYARFLDHKRVPTGEQQRLAYEDAKSYMARFGGDNDANAHAVRKFMTEYEKFIHDYDIDVAYNAKNYPKTFEVGRPILKTDPENFHVLATLIEAGYENAVAGNVSLNAETIDYARRATQLLDAGKVTTADPIKSVPVAQGFLNYVLGWLLKDQAPVEAASAFLKSVKSESPYRTEPMAYHLLGVTILKGEFAQLSADYNQQFGNKPPSPEQTAMFEKITHVAERAIDAYARAVALTTNPQHQEVRNKMLAQLTALYKSFHNDSDAGLNELVATVLTKPLP